MNAQPRITAIITARGGSKGLPRKNIRPLRGKPLLAYSVEAARGVAAVGDVIVTTDDPEIAAVGTMAGAEIIDRPAALSTDSASSVSAVLHTLEVLESANRLPDVVMLLQPTSPLRSSAHIAAAIRIYQETQPGSVVTVCETEHHPYKMLLKSDGSWKPVRDWSSLEAPRQTLVSAFRPNGAIYVVGVHALRSHGSFFVHPLQMMIMPTEDSVDIDSEDDLWMAERVLERRAKLQLCE